jgi:asparagine synthetase B (glutamine-hydrolysing)
MCGIAGVRRFGDDPITGEEIVTLLASIEHRGYHATGIAIENPKEPIHVFKKPVPAWNFILSDEFKAFLEAHLHADTQIVLLHTRWATLGNPEENENNHPMFDGETAVTHNGHISNHTFLFNGSPYKRSCETDSDIIRAIVSHHGIGDKGIRELNKMAGSAAIACVSTKWPGQLLLARSGNPLIVGFTPTGDKMYWASEADAIMRATKPYKEVRGAWVQAIHSNVSLTNMPDNTAWFFSERGKESHHEFRVNAGVFRGSDYSTGHQTYNSRMRGFKKDKRRKDAAQERESKVRDGDKQHLKEVAIEGVVYDKRLKGAKILCPHCKIKITNKKGVPWHQAVCPGCHTVIGASIPA